MTASTRMDKLFSALTAKERALMVLRAWKDGGEEVSFWSRKRSGS